MTNLNDIEIRLSKLRPASQDELAAKILNATLLTRQRRQRRREVFIALGGILTGTAAAVLLMTVLSAPKIEIREIIREVVVEVPAPKPKVEYVPAKYADVKPLDLDAMFAKREALAKRAEMFVSTPIYPIRFQRNEPVTDSPIEYRNLLKEMTQ